MTDNSADHVSSNSKGTLRASKHYVYEVDDAPTFKNLKKWGFVISEPAKYLSTMGSIIIGMILFYVFSSREGTWPLVMLAAIFQVMTLFFMVILAFTDPGIIPKIFSNYEYQEFRRIPISSEYIDGSISDY